MRYTFKEIDTPELYSNSYVVFVMGAYSIFNQYVVDKLKETCCAVMLSNENEDDILEEFGISRKQVRETPNIIGFSEFQGICRSPCIHGRWVCCVDYKFLSKKQVAWVEQYFKKPSKHSLLVITCDDFFAYRKYINWACFGIGSSVNNISLSFPSKEQLSKFIKRAVAARGKEINSQATELFIDRLSTSYEEYPEILDRVCSESSGKKINYEEMLSSLEGIDYYVIDDLVDCLLKPMPSSKISLARTVYKAMGSLLNDVGAIKVRDRLLKSIDRYIEYRSAINIGLIPVRVAYSLADIKKRLPEKGNIVFDKKYKFTRSAYTASKTSLIDWIYMRKILSKANGYSEISCTRALYELMHRYVLDNELLEAGLGDLDILETELRNLEDSELSFGECQACVEEEK